MKTVKQLLEQKGHDVFCISPDAWVYDAIKMMAEKGVGALVVTEDGNLVGIISERDYARKVILKGKSSRETPIKDIMITKVVVTDNTKTVEECMALMSEKRIRHLPVMEDGKLNGIISIGDLVKAIIAEQKFVIDQLENYIYGYPTQQRTTES